MADTAVIFDVDGVLLDLTPEEEDAFFWPFARLHGLQDLSRDWDSYLIRNDEDIITEILEKHFGRKPSPAEHNAVIRTYLDHLASAIGLKRLKPLPVDGAAQLLVALNGRMRLGIATANLVEAAQLRLAACRLWDPVKDLAFGANGGGAKRGSSPARLPNLACRPSASSSLATILTMSRQAWPMASTSSASPAMRPGAAASRTPAQSGFAIITGIR